MINNVPIYDIEMTDEFYYDYDRAPVPVKKRINRLIEMIAEEGHLIPSMNTRTTFREDGLWMGNVTQKRQAWRVLFWVDEDDGVVIFHRLMSHDKRDEYLRV